MSSILSSLVDFFVITCLLLFVVCSWLWVLMVAAGGFCSFLLVVDGVGVAFVATVVTGPSNRCCSIDGNPWIDEN